MLYSQGTHSQRTEQWLEERQRVTRKEHKTTQKWTTGFTSYLSRLNPSTGLVASSGSGQQGAQKSDQPFTGL
ncbi:unnamed protein product [Boreogadus saida]